MVAPARDWFDHISAANRLPADAAPAPEPGPPPAPPTPAVVADGEAFLEAVRATARTLVAHYRARGAAADLARRLKAAGVLPDVDPDAMRPDPGAVLDYCRGLVARGTLDRSDPVFDGLHF